GFVASFIRRTLVRICAKRSDYVSDKRNLSDRMFLIYSLSMANVELTTVLAEARNYVRQAKSASTVRAYRSDWRHFEGWCVDRGREAMPALEETTALYLTELARTHRVSSLTRRLASLSEAHQLAGLPSPAALPTIRTLMSGIRRVKGTARV